MLSSRKPCVPTGPGPVDEVRLSISSSSGEVGQTSTFIAQAYANGKKVSGQTYVVFSNSDSTKATAVVPGGAGQITRLAAGTTSIVVKVGTVSSSPLVITVLTPVLATLILSPTSLTLQSGQSTSLTYAGTSAFGVPVTGFSATGEAENPLHATFGLIAGGVANVLALGTETTSARVRVKSGSVVSNWTTVLVTAIPVGPGGDPGGDPGGGGTPPASDLTDAISTGDYDNGMLVFFDTAAPVDTATEHGGIALADARIVAGNPNLAVQIYRSGTAVSARLSSENDSLRIDFTVGLTGSGADIELSGLGLVEDHTISTIGNIGTLGSLRTTVEGPRVFISGPDDPGIGLPTLVVHAADNLNTVIAGLTVNTKLLLHRGDTWNQEFNPQNPPGVDRIVVAYDGAPLPAGTISRAQGLTLGKPRIIAPTNRPALLVTAAEDRLPHNLVLQGIDFVAPSTTDNTRGIVSATDLDNPTRLKELPSNWRIDQCGVYGGTGLNSWNRCGFNMSVNGWEMRYPWVENIYYQNYPNDVGYDSQAVRIIWGGSRFRIKGGFLSSSHEHFAIGSSLTLINQFRITDGVFDGVHMYSPPSWRGLHAHKNSEECKHGLRFKFQNCIMENGWVENQKSPAFSFWTALNLPWALCADMEVFRCVGINTPEFFEITDRYANDPSFGLTARRFKFHESASIGLGNSGITSFPGTGALYTKWTRIASQAGGLPYDIELDHNFGLTPNQDGSFPAWLQTNAGAHTRLRVKNNVGGVSGGFDAVFSSPSGNEASGWNADANTNGSNEWHHNFLQCPNPAAMINPGQNTYVPIGNLHLNNEATAHNPTATIAQLTDLALAPGSSGIGTAEGGANPGPDFVALQSALAGVRQTADLPT